MHVHDHHRHDKVISLIAGAGGDGGQMFINKRHGTLIWGLRMLDLPHELGYTKAAWAPLGLVQGPTEPTSLADILQQDVDFFVKHDPGT